MIYVKSVKLNYSTSVCTYILTPPIQTMVVACSTTYSSVNSKFR